ncbi:hypothetical protein [Psychromonas sp. L1A2]|uniref:hypothetical protein n=1 Tax=Psychromonas sp. L1A2 TaxID=2686356 RepID=UPI0013568E9A|nr:hypothetical protein [Psychromonas sp. L1A2]
MTKRLKICALLLVLGSITSCASSPHAIRNLLVTGVVNLSDMPASVAKTEGYDIKAQIRSAYDFNFNTNDLDDRLFIIKTLRPNCPNPIVINESIVEGTTPIGVTMNWYYMDIKCI